MTDHSEALDQLATALAKAQSQVKSAVRDSLNPFFKSKYADLASIWDACRDALTSNGLSIAQFPGPYENGTASLTTILLHSSGQWISEKASAPVAGKGNAVPDAQGVGSAISYLKRYAIAAVAGVVTEDDDGNAATGKPSLVKSPSTDKVSLTQRDRVHPTPGGNPQGQDASPGALSSPPRAFTQQEAGEVFDAVDTGTGEQLVPLNEAAVTNLRALIRSAGITKGVDFGPFYERVTGRTYEGRIYTADEKALVAEATKILARKK